MPRDEEAAFDKSVEGTIHVLIGIVTADPVMDRFAVVRTLADSLKDLLFQATLSAEADGSKLMKSEHLHVIDYGESRPEMLGRDEMGAVYRSVDDGEFVDMIGKACEELPKMLW